MKKTLLSEIERYFRPEFINRLDDVIVFRPLTRNDLVGIVEFELKKVRGRLKERSLTLELDDTAKDFLIEKGYNPDFGARPLRRAIEQYVEDPLSEAILRSEYKGPQTIKVSREEGADSLKLIFTPTEQPAAKSGADLAKAGAEST
jgi:ATP-dependent Clp protease ATP-binding subunit ClpC